MSRTGFALAFLALAACSPKHLIIGAAANALGGEGPGWGTDDDPELVAQATPFALKTIESLLESEPDNDKLLLAACSGFTQYAYAFVLQPAEIQADKHPDRLQDAHARAPRLLARAYGYCLRGLNVRHPHFSQTFQAHPDEAMKPMEVGDVPLLYWTAASLALRISQQKDDPQLLADLPSVGVLAERALALDEPWDHGTLHELLEAYEAGRPAAAGGSVERARVHRDRALAESENKKLGPLVTWVEDVSVAKQDKAEFNRLLDQVLAFDVDSAPEYRLANVLAQRRAGWLKAHVDDYFF